MAPEATFQPDAEHAVTAQQGEINELRREIAVRGDRNVYLSACMLQLQVEAGQQNALLAGEISALKGEIEKIAREYEILSNYICEQDANADIGELLSSRSVPEPNPVFGPELPQGA